MLGIALIGLAFSSIWSSQRTSAVLGAQNDLSQTTLLQETNEERSALQQAPLALDERLSQAAQAKAQDMIANNYWAHTSPAGKAPWDFFAASGYAYSIAGENLAYGFASADETITAWMNSPEHRNNILNANYQNVGFGVATAPNFLGNGPQIIVVAEYASPATVTATVNPQPTTIDLSNQIARPVTRVELLASSQAANALLAVIAVTAAAFVFLLTRHTLRLHKVLVASERFVLKHPFLDIAVVAVVTAGLILTRSSGAIH